MIYIKKSELHIQTFRLTVLHTPTHKHAVAIYPSTAPMHKLLSCFVVMVRCKDTLPFCENPQVSIIANSVFAK